MQALKQLTLEELMEVEVLSVTKGQRGRLSAPAAVTVITNDDIRRSGATSLPELLRMVPGLHVARVTSGIWGVSSRGFSSANSAKLLVLMDGRSLYTPLFSGVFWDVQDTPLEDVERIEVIRGPGASLWGANAMNGVINITTKSALETRGSFVEAAAGSEKLFGTVRHGASVGENFHYRAFASYFDRDASVNPSGPERDDHRLGRFGVRSDWRAGERDSLTVQGDLYRGSLGLVSPSVSVTGGQGPFPQPPFEVDLSGGHLLGRWRRTLSESAEMTLHSYFDRTARDDPFFHDRLETFDVDFQHRSAPGERHDLLWGLSYRLMQDRFVSRGSVRLLPPSKSDELFSGFVQDEMELAPALRLVLGTKLEHNDFSGFELQPNVRLSWDLSPRQALWGAASRAVRTPTRIERDIFASLTAPDADPQLALVGNRDLHAEELEAFELGYRVESRTTFLDVALFYNRYDRLVTFGMGEPRVDEIGRTLIPFQSLNAMDGDARGGEVSLEWFPRSRWRLSGSYTFLDLDVDAGPRALSPQAALDIEGASPRHQIALRSALDLSRGFSIDAAFRWVDRLAIENAPAGQGSVPSYSSVDLRLGWSGSRGVDLALVGQDLLDDRHAEFAGGTLLERRVYAKVTWHF